MQVAVTVTTPQAFDDLAPDSFLQITFTNTTEFTYVAGNVLYYALLTDSSDPEVTQEVTFKINHTEGGVVAEETPQTFTIENTQDLVPTVTGSNGKIFYHAA